MYPYIYIFDRQIGTYGLCVMLGFWLAGILAIRKGKPLGLKIEDLVIVAAITFGGTLIGGGLLYVFVTYPIDQIIEFIRQGDFRFLASGLVFYGGLIVGGLGAILGAKISKCSFSVLERSVVPFVPLGHAVVGPEVFSAAPDKGVNMVVADHRGLYDALFVEAVIFQCIDQAVFVHIPGQKCLGSLILRLVFLLGLVGNVEIGLLPNALLPEKSCQLRQKRL